MTTNESTARAIAARKGYDVQRTRLLPDDIEAYVLVCPATGRAWGPLPTWRDVLRALFDAPALGTAQERIGGSMAEIRAELERRADDPRPAS